MRCSATCSHPARHNPPGPLTRPADPARWPGPRRPPGSAARPGRVPGLRRGTRKGLAIIDHFKLPSNYTECSIVVSESDFPNRGMRMAWIVGLQRWVSVATAVSLLVTAAALVFALTAAARAHADSQVLSRRLVPAAAASGVLLGQYADQQTSLRNYVTSGRATGLAAFRQAAGPVPAEQARVAGLVRGYRL